MPYSKFTIRSNQLIKYMFSSAVARNRIINDIINPVEFKPFLEWYKEYKPAFREYMNTQDFDPSFGGLKTNLINRVAISPDQERKIEKELEAIDLTSKIEVFQKIKGAKCFTLETTDNIINISGLTVKTAATNIVQLHTNAKNKVGLIFPYLKSTAALTGKMAKYHGTLLHWFAEKQLAQYGCADPKLCVVVDLFNSKTTVAPSAYKRIRDEIGASCQEILERLEQRSLQVNHSKQIQIEDKKIIPF